MYVKRFRLLPLLSVTAASGLLLAASAGAATVTPTGIHLATSSTVQVKAAAIGLTFPCWTSNISDNVAANGTGVLAAPGGFAASGCTASTTGTYVVSQPSSWASRISVLSSGGSLSGVQVALDVPSGGVKFHSNTMGCDFTASGTLNAAPVAATAYPVTFSSFTFNNSASAPSTLRIDGSTCVFFPVNSNLNYTGSYNLQHAITVTGP
jgi:hypothetical protein